MREDLSLLLGELESLRKGLGRTQKEISRSQLVVAGELGRFGGVQQDIEWLEQETSARQAELEVLTEAERLLMELLGSRKANTEVLLSKWLTFALSYVLDDQELEGHVSIIQKGGQTQIELVVSKDGKERDLLRSLGGGTADIVSFVMQVVVLMLSDRRKILIADEPFSQVSEEYLPNVARFLEVLSTKMDLQILLVTHSETLARAGDKVYWMNDGRFQEHDIQGGKTGMR